MVNGDDAVGANAYGGEIINLERTAYEAYGEETARGGAAAVAAVSLPVGGITSSAIARLVSNSSVVYFTRGDPY